MNLIRYFILYHIMTGSTGTRDLRGLVSGWGFVSSTFHIDFAHEDDSALQHYPTIRQQGRSAHEDYTTQHYTTICPQGRFDSTLHNDMPTRTIRLNITQRYVHKDDSTQHYTTICPRGRFDSTLHNDMPTRTIRLNITQRYAHQDDST
jgi:hypothetical protein